MDDKPKTTTIEIKTKGIEMDLQAALNEQVRRVGTEAAWSYLNKKPTRKDYFGLFVAVAVMSGFIGFTIGCLLMAWRFAQ